jgi:hypothetical protein
VSGPLTLEAFNSNFPVILNRVHDRDLTGIGGGAGVHRDHTGFETEPSQISGRPATTKIINAIQSVTLVALGALPAIALSTAHAAPFIG